jgi:hypothetical protein
VFISHCFLPIPPRLQVLLCIKAPTKKILHHVHNAASSIIVFFFLTIMVIVCYDNTVRVHSTTKPCFNWICEHCGLCWWSEKAPQRYNGIMTGFGGILGTEEVHFFVYNNLVFSNFNEDWIIQNNLSSRLLMETIFGQILNYWGLKNS